MINRDNESTFAATVKSNLFAVLFFLAVAVLILTGIENTKQTQQEHALQTAEDSIRRAVITCYAIEGSYPESYEYIREHYGVSVNEEKYFIHYSVYASNVMPDFRIIER